MSDNDRGLYQKYTVRRTNGSSEPGGKHEHCEYFVLDLDHDKFAYAALKAYANACKKEYRELARDLEAMASVVWDRFYRHIAITPVADAGATTVCTSCDVYNAKWCPAHAPAVDEQAAVERFIRAAELMIDFVYTPPSGHDDAVLLSRRRTEYEDAKEALRTRRASGEGQR